jgi:hypothetical protein
MRERRRCLKRRVNLERPQGRPAAGDNLVRDRLEVHHRARVAPDTAPLEKSADDAAVVGVLAEDLERKFAPIVGDPGSLVIVGAQEAEDRRQV